jgi:hypothetical protein
MVRRSVQCRNSASSAVVSPATACGSNCAISDGGDFESVMRVIRPGEQSWQPAQTRPDYVSKGALWQEEPQQFKSEEIVLVCHCLATPKQCDRLTDTLLRSTEAVAH